MMDNKVSATLSTEQVDQVIAKVDEIAALMPWLLNLSEDARRMVLRMGDASKPFVEKSLEVARQYEEVVPRGIDIEEMRKDFELAGALYTLRVKLNNLLQKVEDTSLVAGNEAFTAALRVYGSAKANGKALGMDAELEELSKRWKRSKPSSTGSASAEPDAGSSPSSATTSSG